MSLDELDKDLATKQLAGFWASNITGNDGDVIEPRTTVVPYLWKWDHIYNGLLEAGELVSLEQSERRTIRLLNPGVPGTTGATNTVHTSVQLVKPGRDRQGPPPYADRAPLRHPGRRRLHHRPGRAVHHASG